MLMFGELEKKRLGLTTTKEKGVAKGHALMSDA
jgi:hypothetical protein